jgi:hypothetical protein
MQMVLLKGIIYLVHVKLQKKQNFFHSLSSRKSISGSSFCTLAQLNVSAVYSYIDTPDTPSGHPLVSLITPQAWVYSNRLQGALPLVLVRYPGQEGREEFVHGFSGSEIPITVKYVTPVQVLVHPPCCASSCPSTLL